MRSFGNIAMASSLIAAVNAVPTTGSSALIKRDDPVCDVQFHDDASGSNYQCYVEKNAANILGTPMTVSADLHCDGPSCQEIKSDIHTVTQGFTFSVGVESSGEAEERLKAGVNAGAS
ncbi:hypothetical protein HII31_07682 [Pseudocercospora fuligena]|uniref:Uncharacterized protein n=1 Tax=Pseudocercospora fuligena TaxID=685502 RepID=A0A8H6VGU8_9PEZI|nr:hypothetical protein HII31_07682 [Pseudocercospora fuligena]